MNMEKLFVSRDAAGKVNGIYANAQPDLAEEALDANSVELKELTKSAKWAEIKTERDRRIQTSGYKIGMKWFHSDQVSRSQQQDNEAMGADLEPVEWKTMDGSFVTMTPALAAQIRTARIASDRAIFAVAEAHKTAMETTADPANYDFSGGWPEVFGGK